MKRTGPPQRRTPLRRTARFELAARGVDAAVKRVNKVLAAPPPFDLVPRGPAQYDTHVLARFVEHPRALPPLRSAEYRGWVRSGPCVCCRRSSPVRIDAAHFGPRGVGQKTDDVRVVAVCRDCHRFQTDNGYLPLDGPDTVTLVRARGVQAQRVEDLRARTRLLVAEAALAALALWFRQEAHRA